MDSETEVSVTNALRACPHPEIKRLSVTVADGRITLSGKVSSYYLKQLAQETVKRHGVVRNLVAVEPLEKTSPEAS